MIVPDKLSVGDEIRIIAPSRSARILSKEGVKEAKLYLEMMGFTVTFGDHIFEEDLQGSTSIEKRTADLQNAFIDSNVKAILTVIGGFNSNELLDTIDYECIRQNPKIFCGYSDITAVATAITTKTGLVTYSGPHFSSFYMKQAQAYQKYFFEKCLMQKKAYQITPSNEWSDDAWYLDQESRHFEKTQWKVYSKGKAEGRLYGGNLCTLNLLQGTSYMPRLEDCILFIEDDEMTFPEIFSRDFTSLLQNAKRLKGLVIGRFQRSSKMTEEQLLFILNKHSILKTIPVLYDVDFGHTQPIFTFPIGGHVEVNSHDLQINLTTF